MAEKEITDDLDQLLPCSICSRTFRPGILSRHERVCEKTLSKKRKVFDSFKTRVQGTDLEEFLGPAPLPGQPPRLPPKETEKEKKPTKLPKWKQTHEVLIATLRAARGQEVPAPTSNGGAAVVSLATSENEQCPTCGRCFGPRAYDRHVEFCREMMSRKAKTPPKPNAAQERMEARIKYKAPLLVKRSRPDGQMVNKSVKEPARPVSVKQPVTPGPIRKTTVSSTLNGTRPAVASATVKRIPSSSSTGSSKEVSNEATMSRNSIRSSVRGRPTTSIKRVSSPTKKQPAPEPLMKLDIGKIESPPRENLNSTYSKTTMEAITAAAEQQMRDLLSWSSDSDLSTIPKPIHSRQTVQSNLPQIHKSLTPSSSSPLLSSPSSAFAPVPSKYDNGNIAEKTKYLDENDNSMLGSSTTWRDNGYNVVTSTPKPKPAPRTPGTIRRSLDCPIIKRRPDSTDDRDLRFSNPHDGSQISDELMADWPNPQLIAYGKPLSKSKKRNFARSKSVFEDRNKMLFLQTYESDMLSSDEEGREVSSSHFSPHHSAISHYRPSSPVFKPSGIVKDGFGGGGDSAYSSLNRRSPRNQEEPPPSKKFSKFCHECGSKYPLAMAKFCCECGVRRLLI